MKKLGAIQSSFLPWMGYFDIIKKSDIFIFYDHVQYDKNGWRNRNKIISLNKNFQWLTVPVIHNSIKKKLCETQIHEPEKNLKKILKSIFQAYSKHPNFESFYQVLENRLKTNYTYLNDLNIDLIKDICSYQKIKANFLQSKDFKNSTDKNQNLINLCLKFNCETYISGRLGEDYLDIELFRKNNIKIEFNDFVLLPYKQKNLNKFVSNLSIIDYIFNYEK